MLGRRLQSPARGVDHRHRILHRDRLAARCLHIDLGAPQAGKNEGLFCDQQMRAIEFGGDMHREIEASHRLERDFRIGHRNGKVAAETDQGLGSPIPDCLDSFDGVVALVARRFESEYAGNSVQQFIARNLGNADRAVSLHIRVPPQRRNAGALAPDIAAKHQEIGDLLNISRAMAMLGDPHAVIDDDPLRLGIDVSDVLDFRSRQTRGLLDRVPGGRIEVGQQRVDPGGMILDKVAIEDTGPAFGAGFLHRAPTGSS